MCCFNDCLLDFVDHDFKVIHRDDGGHDYLKLADLTPITVWYPEKCKFICEHPNLTLRTFNHEKPADLVANLISAKRERFNVVLLDTFVLDWELSADFWCGFLKAFITAMMQLDITEKTKIVLSVDELNDLIQPAHFQLTEVHNEVRAMIELCIRKLRKHGVKLVATAHRPNQLTRNIRSEFSFGLVKQCCGSDLYNFLNHELVHISGKVFWKVLKDIKDLTPQFFYLFDKKGNFDKFTLPNLPETMPYHRCEVILQKDDVGELKGWERVRLWIKVLLKALSNQLSSGYVNYRGIAELLGVDHTYVYEILNKKLLSDLELRALADQIVALKRNKKVYTLSKKEGSFVSDT